MELAGESAEICLAYLLMKGECHGHLALGVVQDSNGISEGTAILLTNLRPSWHCPPHHGTLA